VQVQVVVTDEWWLDGKLMQETRYESEQEVEAVQEEEGEDTQEWDMEEDEVGSWAKGAHVGLGPTVV